MGENKRATYDMRMVSGRVQEIPFDPFDLIFLNHNQGPVIAGMIDVILIQLRVRFSLGYSSLPNNYAG